MISQTFKTTKSSILQISIVMAWSICFSLPIRRVWISSLTTTCWNLLQNFKVKDEWEHKKLHLNAKLKVWKTRYSSTKQAFVLQLTDPLPKCKRSLPLTKLLSIRFLSPIRAPRTRKMPLRTKANTSSTNYSLLNLAPNRSSRTWDQLTKTISSLESISVT